jgi:hypothetical protein
MNKTFKVIALTLGCLLMSSVAFAQYTEFIVEPGGSGTTYPDLASAVATAQAFTGEHRIVVTAGAYADMGVVIDHTQPGKIREIVGDGKDLVTFTSPITPGWPITQGHEFLDVAATTGIMVTGISVIGYEVGIATWGPMATDLVVDDCIFDGNTAGIYVASNGGTFSGLEIMNGSQGFQLFSMVGGEAINDNTVTGCSIHDIYHAPAIFFAIQDHFVGSPAASLNGNSIIGCDVYDNTDQGIIIAGGYGGAVNNTTVQGCNIYNNQWNAVVVMGATGGAIDGNTCYGNAKGDTNPNAGTSPSPVSVNTYTAGAVQLMGCSGFQVINNTVYDNGGFGTTGGGTGWADYGISVDGSSTSVRWNCLFDHDGVEGEDNGDGSNWWNGNYYEQLTGTSYALDGTGVEVDYAPMKFDVSATGQATAEVFDVIDVNIEWTIPGCSGADGEDLAAYEFTVTYDPAVLALVPGSAGYDYTFLGAGEDGALYTAPDDATPGQITFAATNFDMPHLGDGIMASMQFTAINTGATQITVGSQYKDGDNNFLVVGNTPLNINVQDLVAPSGTVVFNDPLDEMTFSNFYDMEFSGTGHDQYCLSQVWYRVVEGYIGWNLVPWVTNDGNDGTYGPVTVSMAPLPEGTYTLEVLFRDCSSNDHSEYRTFKVDKTGPNASGVTITDSDGCADAGYTSSELCNVTWTDDGSAVEMELALTGLPVPFVAYDNTTTYTFPSIEGPYTLHVRLKDEYGNTGAYSAGTLIILDKTAPAPSAAWLVSSPTPAKTNTDLISGDCNLDAASGALYAKAAENGVGLGCGDAGWVLISSLGTAPRFAFDLSDNDGMKSVTFASKDAAGNVGTVIATIELDKTAAEFGSFAIADPQGTVCSDSWTVDVTVTWTAADVAWLRLGSATGVYGTAVDISAATSPFTTSYTIVGGSCDAVNTVFGVIEDNIGNIGGESSAGIFVDCAVPTAGTLSLNGGFTWSADPVVAVDLTGMSMDIENVRMSLISGDYTAATWEAFDPNTPSTTFDFGAPAENTNVSLYLQANDCAGRISPEVTDWVRFDFTAPLFNSVDINGGAAKTNSVNVTVNVNITEVNQQKIQMSEDDTFATGVAEFVTPVTVGGFSFTLSGLDGTKEVFVKSIDLAGNESVSSATILLDGAPPTAGTFVITSGNTLAAAGYTNSLTGNTYVFTAADADADQIWIQNQVNAAQTTTGWDDLPGAATGTLVALDGGGAGIKTVNYWVLDDAGNQGGPFQASIDFNSAAPPAPLAGSGAGDPGGSVMLTWGAVTDAKGYEVRYNFTNEYPTYVSGPPPWPMTRTEGIKYGALHTTNSCLFDGPQDDLYAFAIWTLSKHGVWSTVPNIDVMEHNYRLGDIMDQAEVLGADGCLSFDPEFVYFGAAYNTSPAGNPLLDIAPTDDGTATGIVQPDDAIDFEDLVIFALNYQWSRAKTECDGQKSGGTAAASLADVTVSAEIPSYSRIGNEFQVPIVLSEGAGVAGYHLVFNYDVSTLEVVSVDPGAVYAGVDRSFFYYDADAPGIDISSVVLNDGGLASGEIAVVTFRSVVTGQVALKDELLDVRDWNNHKASVRFDVAAKGGSLPTEYELSQNYPNPFNPSTTIELALPQASVYRLTIYNVIGQVVDVFEGQAEAGYVTINWDASKQSSGVYLYRVSAGTFSDTKKMILLK